MRDRSGSKGIGGSIHIGALGSTLALALLLIGLAMPGVASAHNRRDLLGGKYQAVAGWLNEPAFDDQLNGFDLSVRDQMQKDAQGVGKPVEGLEQSLKVEVIYAGAHTGHGGETLELELRARHNLPGRYAAYFHPTQAERYTVRLYGQLDGQAIDERFELAAPEASSAVQFPKAEEEHVGHIIPELHLATALSIAGLIMGMLGLAAGIVALRRGRGATAAGAGGRMAVQGGHGD